MKKFISPFNTEKYKFLEKKWWHRLMKIIFFLLIWIWLFSSVLIYSSMKSPQKHTSEIKQVFGELSAVVNDLAATIAAKPDITVEELTAKFPEFSTLDTQVVGELGATISQNPDITTEEIKSLFPELMEIKTSVWSYIFYYIQIILYTAITTYVLSIALQLIYFKWIIYIVYWDKNNK